MLQIYVRQLFTQCYNALRQQFFGGPIVPFIQAETGCYYFRIHFVVRRLSRLKFGVISVHKMKVMAVRIGSIRYYKLGNGGRMVELAI